MKTIIAILVAAVCASATDWYPLEFKELYMDTSSIRTGASDGTVWVKKVDSAGYTIDLIKFDLKNKKAMFVEIIDYSSDDKFIKSTECTSRWDNIVPESVMEFVFDQYKSFWRSKCLNTATTAY